MAKTAGGGGAVFVDVINFRIEDREIILDYMVGS